MESSTSFSKFNPLPPINSGANISVDDNTKNLSTCSDGSNNNVFNEPLKCPFWIYIILVGLSIGAAIFFIASLPNIDNQGDTISAEQKWLSAIISIFVALLISALFGWWIFKECHECRFGESWFILIAAILTPLIVFFIVLLLFSTFVGINIWYIS